MYIGVKKILSITEYSITIEFTNGDIKVVELSPYLNKGLFIELTNPELFATAHVSFDAIEWSNGADIDPEFLFDIGLAITDAQGA